MRSKVTIAATCVVVLYIMDKISRANSLLKEEAELLNPSNGGPSESAGAR